MEQLALQGLREVVRAHIQSGTIDNTEIALFDLIMNEKETNIQCPGTLPRAGLTILGQNDGTLVVLVQSILLDINALCLQKQTSP